MRRVIRAKWRPSLLMVIGGVLGCVLALPFLGYIAMRLLRPDVGVQMSYGIVAACLIGGTLLLGLALRRLLLRPISALSARAQNLAAGGPVEPLEHYGTQELRDLGQVVLDMGATLQAREISVRSYSDHITHELKSPLTAILGAAEMLEDGDMSQQDARLLQTIRASGTRMENLLESLRNFAAATEAHYAGSAQLRDVARALEPEFSSLNISAGNFEVGISREGLEIILRHLLSNAQAHGASHVEITKTSTGFRLADSGTGLSEGIAVQIFEPFFTTRRESGGTGMGLAIVARVLGTLGGEIVAVPSNTGAVFEIRLSQ